MRPSSSIGCRLNASPFPGCDPMLRPPSPCSARLRLRAGASAALQEKRRTSRKAKERGLGPRSLHCWYAIARVPRPVFRVIGSQPKCPARRTIGLNSPQTWALRRKRTSASTHILDCGATIAHAREYVTRGLRKFSVGSRRAMRRLRCRFGPKALGHRAGLSWRCRWGDTAGTECPTPFTSAGCIPGEMV